jgi:hypothetical protein
MSFPAGGGGGKSVRKGRKRASTPAARAEDTRSLEEENRSQGKRLGGIPNLTIRNDTEPRQQAFALSRNLRCRSADLERYLGVCFGLGPAAEAVVSPALSCGSPSDICVTSGDVRKPCWLVLGIDSSTLSQWAMT